MAEELQRQVAEELQRQVAEELQRQAGLTLEDWEVLAGGRSAPTFGVRIVDDSGAVSRAVVHVEPDFGPHVGIASVDLQFELLTALERTPVPTPRALRVGAPARGGKPAFLITEWVDGSVPNPWRSSGRTLLASERTKHPGRLAEDFVRVLAEIHSVPIEDLPARALPSGARPPSHALRELERWTAGIEASERFAHDPLLTYAREWLRTNAPASSESTLVHGDYRVGNLVVVEGCIAAVLDWELARVGDPLLDVATVCSPPLRVDGLAAGLWEPARFVERYAELTGREIDPTALAYYVVMATFKVAGVWVNASRLYACGHRDLASLRAGFSVLEARRMVAESLGLPLALDAGADPASAALAEVYETLREAIAQDVLTSVHDPAAREAGVAIRSVLRELASLAALAGDDDLGGEVAALLDDLRTVVPGIAVEERAPAHARLADAVRAAFAHLGPKAGTDPRLEALRRLVGRSAAMPLGMWP